MNWFNPSKSHLNKMTKYPNEMLWNMLNDATKYPERNITWEERCKQLTVWKNIVTPWDQRLDILRQVDHCLANYVQLYFDKGLQVPESEKYWYDVCLKVRKLIM